MMPQPKPLERFWRALTKKHYIHWPYLDLYVHIPLLTIRTDVMVQAIERAVFEYIGLYVKLWKWEFRCRLYTPDRERYAKQR